MATWYYYNESGEKIGPVRGRDLKQLAQQGAVTPETKVEDSEGHIALAKKVTGLTFPSVIPLPSNSAENLEEQDFERLREEFERQRELESAIQQIVPLAAPPAPLHPAPPAGANPFAAVPPGTPFAAAPPPAQSAQPAPPPFAHLFCTNCGHPIAEQAVACMACGAKPTGHKKFCRYCGVALNPAQVICTKCGAGIGSKSTFAFNADTIRKLVKPAVIAGIVIVAAVGIVYLAAGSIDRDRAAARRDLREIHDYITQHTRNNSELLAMTVFDIQYVQQNMRTLENMTEDMIEDTIKYFNMKRAANFDAWKRAADKEYPEGQVLLGVCYFVDADIPKNDAEKAKWFFEAAKTANCFRKAAERGNALGQFLFGLCNFEGAGVPENAAEGVKWTRKAAERGLTEAQTTLFGLYYTGTGIPQNEAEAVKWLHKIAMKKDMTDSQWLLGMFYLEGKGVPKNEVEAVKWFRKAADKDFISAQAALGKCYLEGTGVSKNEAEAVKWLRKAADKNNAEAQYLLGLCYFEGKGVPLNKTEAVGWYLKAAERRHTEAAYQIALCYHTGEGIPKNPAEAQRWLITAMDCGKEVNPNLKKIILGEEEYRRQELLQPHHFQEPGPGRGRAQPMEIMRQQQQRRLLGN